MPFELPFLSSTLAGSCQAGIHFTTDQWELQYEKSLVLKWAGGTGAVSINLVKLTAGGFIQAAEVAKDYAGTAFVWTPSNDLTPGEYVFRIRDGLTSDESPKLALRDYTMQGIASTTATDDTNNEHSSNGNLTPGIGSIVGGILLFGLVAFLNYRGRNNRARLGGQADSTREAEGTTTQHVRRIQVDFRLENQFLWIRVWVVDLSRRVLNS
ncbi:hypothetical protein AAE478_006383 [Parahypoxylon ruwenzoriense]